MFAEIVSDSSGIAIDENLSERKPSFSTDYWEYSLNYPNFKFLKNTSQDYDCFLATSTIMNIQMFPVQYPTNDLEVNNIEYSGVLFNFEENVLVHKKTHFQVKNSFAIKAKIKFTGKTYNISKSRVIEINS